MTELEPVIGLEVHAELQTSSKMFCACAVVDSTSAAPNTAVCEICTGLPGTLPAVNARAVDFALRVALALSRRNLRRLKRGRTPCPSGPERKR